jgi:hypothetical protein
LGGHLLNWQGEYREANERHAEALQLARERGLLFPMLWSLCEYGVAITGGGGYDDAMAILDVGIGLCEKVGKEIMRHRMLNTLGWLYLELGASMLQSISIAGAPKRPASAVTMRQSRIPRSISATPSWRRVI